MFHPQGPSFYELAVQALSSTKRGYDLLAPKFEYTPFRTPDEVIDEAIRCTLGNRNVDSVLDVCCGTGAAMRLLKPRCENRVVGIDFSPGMLEVAKERVAGEPGAAHVEFVCEDVLEMDFQAEFDLAVCFGALGHIVPRDQDRFVQRIHRALQPGGVFAFATCKKPSLVSHRYWLARGFNAAMHVRNVLVRPPFIMFYLNFMLDQATSVLERNGFRVDVTNTELAKPYDIVKIVMATRN